MPLKTLTACSVDRNSLCWSIHISMETRLIGVQNNDYDVTDTSNTCNDDNKRPIYLLTQSAPSLEVT